MGRTIVVEESLESHISTLYSKDKWVVGLVIGQITDQKDYAVHLAPTPKAESSTENSSQDNVKEKKTGNVDDLSDAWISVHARQVLRMLPGGFGILGIFCVAQPNVMKDAQAKLRQLLFAVHKVTSSTETDESRPVSSERAVLQICPLTRKIICRTFDVSNNKSSAKPAELKYQKFLDKWHTLECSVAIDHVIPVPNTAMSQSLEKQLLKGVEPICDNIWNSMATINDELLEGDCLLNPSQPSGKKGKRSQEEASGLLYNVDLFSRASCSSDGKFSRPVLTPCGAKLTIRGTMCCRAFVHGKATVADALKAIRTDIVRSVISRCELLCEDLLQAEEEQDRKVLYEAPLRVFCPLRESSIQLCDYMFQDETNNDVVDRLKELIDLTVPEDTLETDCEKIPDEHDVSQARQLHESINTTTTPQNFEKSNRMILLLLCLVAALLAILIAFHFNNFDS